MATVGAGVALVQRSSAEREANRADSPPRAQVQASNDEAPTTPGSKRTRRQSPAPSPRPAASARKHWWRTTTTRRCSWHVEGRHLEDSPETEANLLATIQRSPDAIAVIRSETEAFLDLGLTPDGTTLVASGGDPASMSKYDVTTRELEASIPGSGQSPARSVPTAATR